MPWPPPYGQASVRRSIRADCPGAARKQQSAGMTPIECLTSLSSNPAGHDVAADRVVPGNSTMNDMTVRDAVLQLLRAFGMRRIFGNPGSTELPLFLDFPADFEYVLGLQESVVVGMADGYADGDAQRRLRQPAFGGRRRPRDGRDLHRLEEPHAAGHHRRPAGALAVPVRSVPVLGAGDRAAEAVRQVELRAGARRGRAAGDRPRLLRRDAAAARPGAGLDPGRRLGADLRAGRAAHASARAPRCRRRRARRDRRRARRQPAAGLRRRRRRRPRRRLGRGARARRAAPRPRLHRADVGALRLRRGPSAVRRLPAGDARADRRRPRRQRPRAGARRAGVHLPRRRRRAAPAGGRRALPDHRRSRDRRLGAGRHRRRSATCATPCRRCCSAPRRATGRMPAGRPARPRAEASPPMSVATRCRRWPRCAGPSTSSSRRRRARAR